jgi:hypothetical protein
MLQRGLQQLVGDLNESTSLARFIELVTIQPTPPAGPIHGPSSPTPSLGGPVTQLPCAPAQPYGPHRAGGAPARN